MPGPRRTLSVVVVTALAFVALFGCGGLLFVYSGIYDVSASSKDDPVIAWMLHKTYEASLHRHGGGDLPPADLLSLENIRAGAHFYDASCAACHGAPGRTLSPIGRGIQPAAPDLLAASRRNNPRLMFWVIKHGVNMTAMPAFGKTQPDATLWQTAAFLFHARGITGAEYDALTGSASTASASPGHPG